MYQRPKCKLRLTVKQFKAYKAVDVEQQKGVSHLEGDAIGLQQEQLMVITNALS